MSSNALLYEHKEILDQYIPEDQVEMIRNDGTELDVALLIIDALHEDLRSKEQEIQELKEKLGNE